MFICVFRPIPSFHLLVLSLYMSLKEYSSKIYWLDIVDYIAFVSNYSAKLSLEKI